MGLGSNGACGFSAAPMLCCMWRKHSMHAKLLSTADQCCSRPSMCGVGCRAAPICNIKSLHARPLCPLLIISTALVLYYMQIEHSTNPAS